MRAQDSLQSTSIDDALIADFTEASEDCTKLGRQITMLSSQDIAIGGLLVGGVIALMPLDEQMRALARRNYQDVDGLPLLIANEYGNVLYPAIACIASYGAGLVFKSKELRDISRLTIESLILSGFITTGIKCVAGRSRPYADQGAYVFSGPSTRDASLSLPSGHATVAFAVSTVLSKQCNRWWTDLLFYGLAIGTSYARIHNDKHWLSDVALGGLIGHASATWIYDLQQNEVGHSTGEISYKVIPFIGYNAIGIGLQF